MQPNKQSSQPVQTTKRVQIVYALVVFLFAVFAVRLFYLQIIRHDYYRKAAQSDQLKEYEIPAARGIIEAHSGEGSVPIVLNQKLYTVYADPKLLKDKDKNSAAETLAVTLGGKPSDYATKLDTPNTRYVVIAKKVDGAKKDQIMGHKYSGIGVQEMTYRTYPDGSLASQLLGFVNDEGKGVYGVEQALNKQLAGKGGQLKAVTDVNGVPLAANTDNVQVAPVAGSKVVLTVDIAMQQQLERLLQEGLKNAKSDSGSVVVMDPRTGAIKAMANWPTYDPGDYANVSDASVFNNAAVSSPLEIGSIMKPFTAAAALDQGAVKKDTSYDDPAVWNIDGYKITNIEEDGGSGRRNIADILNLSLNTGATWLLMQLSKPGGTEINDKGRSTWYDYMTNRFQLGKLTGVEQGYEAEGLIPDPIKGYARDLTYANTSFGQAMTATPVQMAAAFSALVNGGTYYKPHLVDELIAPDGTVTQSQPQIVKKNVVSSPVSSDIRDLLQYVVAKHNLRPGFNQDMYAVGGKTGTAQIAKPGGGYLDHDFNGTYLGFVGGDDAQYVIMVRVNKPKIGGYAGTGAAQPIFGSVAHMLIDNFGVTPKSH